MIGNQNPRIKIEPERVSTDGQGAAMLMQAIGITLDEWQRLVLDAWLGKDATGNYTTLNGGLSLARQNGKNIAIEARELYGLLINGERILHTAHQLRTAKKSFRRLAALFEDKKHPEIMKAVKKIRQTIGEESIELNNGGLIEFTSRSRQAARGYDGISLIVLDEAQEVTDEVIEALMATISASATGQRQILYAGTPPYVGCSGEVFRRLRQTCITEAGEGRITHNSWHEWSIPGDTLEGVDLGDKQLWFDCNPALNKRLTLEFTQNEYETLSPAGFARERLGFWAKPISEQADNAINEKAWAACRSDEPKPEGKTAYGVKFSADGAAVVLAGAILPTNGKGRISVIDIRPTGHGITWLVEWLNERYKKASCVVIDGRNGAEMLIERIKPVWVIKDSVIKPSAQNVITAATLLNNEINEQTITWYSGQEGLNESALTAIKRPIAGGWGYGGTGSEIIEACSLALWGCKNSKRNPQRIMRIG